MDGWLLIVNCQAELREMEPRLVATEKEVDEMIVRIDADKASAADTKVCVSSLLIQCALSTRVPCCVRSLEV
jgi:hypothetical protein